MNVRVSSFEETRTNKNLANCCGVRCPAFALCASSNACSLFATLCLPVGNCAFALAPFGFVAKRSYPYPSSVSLFRRVLRVSLAFEGWWVLAPWCSLLRRVRSLCAFVFVSFSLILFCFSPSLLPYGPIDRLRSRCPSLLRSSGALFCRHRGDIFGVRLERHFCLLLHELELFYLIYFFILLSYIVMLDNL